MKAGAQEVRVAFGDDAAWLAPRDDRGFVWSVDSLMEGVDFHLSEAGPRRVGRKALAVNLSDMAAMGAKPVAALVSLALPRTGALELARELLEGMIPLAEEFSLSIAGGDTNTWDGGLVITVSIVGAPMARAPWLRSTGRPGDTLLATGAFGGSILGRHLDFTPRVDEALRLAGDFEIHAAIDVSDGLSLDAFRLAQASGCGAVLELENIPLHVDALAHARRSGKTPLEHALADGEDFELLLALAPQEAKRLLQANPFAAPLTRVGSLIGEPGLFAEERGARRPLQPRGYEHGGSEP